MDDRSALSALSHWPADRRVMLLHSGRRHERWARRSLLAEPAAAIRCVETGRGGARTHWHGGHAPPCAWSDRPLRDLAAAVRAMPPGHWIGYLSYDLRLWTEPVLRRAARPAPDNAWPLLEFAWCPKVRVFDAEDDAVASPSTSAVGLGPIEPAWSADRYAAAVRRVQAYIAAGDVFQVNLAHRLRAACHGSADAARRLYARLAAHTPAWYGGLLELHDGRAILSASPELFLELDADGWVTTRPIKGTLPAAADPAALRDSPKDQAELTMIVDLLRNDLGRVCDYASVRVTQPRTIETHGPVHQAVATIQGRLHRRRDVFDLLRATLPGGSITGAPKVRAMQIIDELEVDRRGPYCGAMGWIDTTGPRPSACFNILIRTLLYEPWARRLDLWVGAGIVADSDPAAEHAETMAKAAGLIKALRSFD